MKILDVCAFYSPRGGGVRTYIEHKLKAGPARGHEIVILAPGEDHGVEERGDGARIVTIPGPRFPLDPRYRYFNDAAALHAALDRERPDMVEVSSPWGSARLVARWRGSAPRALIMHSDPIAAYAYRWLGLIADPAAIDRRLSWLWRYFRKLGDHYECVVSASNSLSERLRAGGLGRVVTNPMGVEPGLFSPVLRDEGLRRDILARCSLGPDATLLVGIGRHAPEKRWPMVIEAVSAAAWHDPIGLVLIGDGRDRSRVVRQAGGNPHILLLSPIADRPALARLLASADALIHGCEAETFCMVAAEARASGLSLIVPDRGGAADLFRPGEGRLYEAASAASAAAAIAGFVHERGLISRTSDAIPPRTLDDHFTELFALYTGLEPRLRDAA